MPGVLKLHAFGKQTLAATLPAASKNGATTFGLHTGAETELSFPGAFAGLIRPFHKVWCGSGLRKRGATLSARLGVSMKVFFPTPHCNNRFAVAFVIDGHRFLTLCSGHDRRPPKFCRS
jgi:hypothetical protein